MTLRIGSLFSGIGGLDLGLEAALDAETVWQVEQDPYARLVLAKHWPNADRSVTDVRRAGRHNLEPVGLICGGFPCQDISVAGNGAGLTGARSGLWFDYIRIVRELRPRFVVVENVAALRKRGLDVVLGGLAAFGYDAEWHRLSAADVGAPHVRRRLFIIAYLPDAVGDAVRDKQGRECQPPKDGRERVKGADVARHDGEEEPVAHTHTHSHRLQGELPARTEALTNLRGGPGWWQIEPGMGGVIDGIRAGLDGHPNNTGRSVQRWERDTQRTTTRQRDRRKRLQCLGNAVVPQCAYVVGLRVREIMTQR